MIEPEDAIRLPSGVTATAAINSHDTVKPSTLPSERDTAVQDGLGKSHTVLLLGIASHA
jgi:hypothetical protein